MGNTSDKCKCTDCGYEFIGIDLGVPKRPSCPMCQSKLKTIEICLHDEVGTPTESFYMEGRSPKKRRAQGKTGKSVKKPIFEYFDGEDYCHDLGKYVNKLRHIDRENDSYIEIVTDKESGRIIHHDEEKLSEHYDHGSAKKT